MPYSIPLWTIFTKWPAPPCPSQATHGPAGDRAAIASRTGRIKSQPASDPRRHQGRSVARPLLATRHADSEKQYSCWQEVATPLLRMLEMGVPSIENDITRMQGGSQQSQRFVHRIPRRHHQQHPTGRRKQPLEFPDGFNGREIGVRMVG